MLPILEKRDANIHGNSNYPQQNKKYSLPVSSYVGGRSRELVCPQWIPAIDTIISCECVHAPDAGNLRARDPSALEHGKAFRADARICKSSHVNLGMCEFERDQR